jgi:hypothetical protein
MLWLLGVRFTMSTTFLTIVFVVGVLGGGLAAVAGAGIGSTLVPLLGCGGTRR